MGFVKYETKGQVGIITIDRPKALNALNSQVLDDLKEVLDGVDQQEIRCLIVTGSGDKSFVAGADIAAMSTMSQAEAEAFGKKGNDIFRALEVFPIPSIAAVNGFALGGGCELSMSCDFRICSENAVFGQPEVGLGITPGFGGTQRLARLVGPGSREDREECPDRSPCFQEGHQRWSSGGNGQSNRNRRETFRKLFRKL